MTVLRHYLILAVVLLGAVLLRTVGVDSQGLWYDEGLTLTISRWWRWDMLLAPTNPRPPLYYLLQGSFVPTGASLLGVRSVSIVCGVISVGLMYVLGRLSFGRLGGLIAAALLAVWTAHVDYSQEARNYSLQFMLTLAASIGVMVYARAESRRGRLSGLALFAAGNVLSFYTHVVSVFWIAATSLLVLGLAVHRRRPLAEVAATFGIMAVLAIPGLYQLLLETQDDDDGLEWLGGPNLPHFAANLASVLLPAGFWDSPWIHAGKRLIRPVVTLLSLAALGWALWRLGPRLRTSPALPLIAAHLVMPLVIWGFGFVVTPVYMARTVLFVIPGFILLITGFCIMAPRPLLGAGAVVAVYLASSLLFGLMREKEDFRGAARFLEASARPGDIIAVCSIGSYPALRYHTGRPTGAMVLGPHDDDEERLIKLESPLGSDPAWDEHHSVPRRSPATVQIQAGRTVWLVDSHCKGARSAGIEAAVAELDDPGQQVWAQVARSGRTPVAIRRYIARSPAIWPLLQH